MPNIDPEVVKMFIDELCELESIIECLAEDISIARGDISDIDSMLDRETEIKNIIENICDERLDDPKFMKKVFYALYDVGAFDD